MKTTARRAVVMVACLALPLAPAVAAGEPSIAPVAASGLVIVIYLSLQAIWLRRQLSMSHGRAGLVSLGTFLKATVAVAFISSALVV